MQKRPSLGRFELLQLWVLEHLVPVRRRRHLLKAGLGQSVAGATAVSLSTLAFPLDVQNASGADHSMDHSLVKENGLLRFNFHLLGPSPEEILASSR